MIFGPITTVVCLSTIGHHRFIEKQVLFLTHIKYLIVLVWNKDKRTVLPYNYPEQDWETNIIPNYGSMEGWNLWGNKPELNRWGSLIGKWVPSTEMCIFLLLIIFDQIEDCLAIWCKRVKNTFIIYILTHQSYYWMISWLKYIAIIVLPTISF